MCSAKPFQVEEVLARVGTHVELRCTTRELVERNRKLEEEIAAGDPAFKEAWDSLQAFRSEYSAWGELGYLK